MIEIKKVVLLNDSFVSEILLTFLKEEQIPVFAEGSLRKKLLKRKIPVLSLEETQQKLSSADCVVYSNAENFISLVCEHCGNQNIVKAIRLFKNKAQFRRKVSELFPDFYFKEIRKEEAFGFEPPHGKELFLKPTIGFWSVGITRFSGQEGFNRGIRNAMTEIKEYGKIFDSSIIDSANFLIEEAIDGEEFACDAYFDENGTPVVLGIYCHPFRDKNDTRDLVYYTGKKVMEKTIGRVEKFLYALAQETNLVNFPIHFEFVIDKESKLVPIEINPIRFGGFGLVDLAFYSFDINPYEYYFYNKKPKWKDILSNANDGYHGFVLGRGEDIAVPDLEKFKQTFQELDAFIEMEHSTSPVFCIAYTKSNDLNEVVKYVHFDFKKYNLK
ncbi:MAG: ATP-grasp domain-containing protein [Candidatus Micrarchaeota archaeon]